MTTKQHFIKRNGAISLFVSLTTAPLLATLAMAQQNQQPAMPQAPQAPTVESINDTHPSTAYSGPAIGGAISLELRQSEAQDADGVLRRDSGRAELELTLDIEQSLSRDTSVEARLAVSSRRYSEERLNNDDEELIYDLERLFLQIRSSKMLRLRLGRLPLQDSMETIIDEDLDGLQVVFERGAVEMELSHSREDWFVASSMDRQDRITNTMGSLKFRANKDSEWTPYLLHRSNEELKEEATWIGLQGIVQPDQSNWRYWLHGMARNGEMETNNGTATEELSGHAIDTGINYHTGDRLDSTFTVALAHASGGSSDERFRQSGLHSNDFALNDKNAFRYLGEVLDPELTNIQILTLGWGAEPHKHWRTDVALHAYQQTDAEDNLRGADIEYDPNGVNRQLGTGAEFVIGYEPKNALEIKGTAGRFIPGDAFDGDRKDAWLARLEIEISF